MPPVDSERTSPADSETSSLRDVDQSGLQGEDGEGEGEAEERYRPAYELTDGDLERAGRGSSAQVPSKGGTGKGTGSQSLMQESNPSLASVN